mmetsp:Transcript_18826/g.61832  ORF Transcript_18826/g.61832 Transcript_18826/m.61832 type:complete len:227 (-) Transcript_18826:35-715(-)
MIGWMVMKCSINRAGVFYRFPYLASYSSMSCSERRSASSASASSLSALKLSSAASLSRAAASTDELMADLESARNLRLILSMLSNLDDTSSDLACESSAASWACEDISSASCRASRASFHNRSAFVTAASTLACDKMREMHAEEETARPRAVSLSPPSPASAISSRQRSSDGSAHEVVASTKTVQGEEEESGSSLREEGGRGSAARRGRERVMPRDVDEETRRRGD